MGAEEVESGCLGHIYCRYPASVVGYFLGPFHIILCIAAVKVQHILGYQDEFRDAAFLHRLHDFPFQGHDVVFYGVVPQ